MGDKAQFVSTFLQLQSEVQIETELAVHQKFCRDERITG